MNELEYIAEIEKAKKEIIDIQLRLITMNEEIKIISNKNRCLKIEMRSHNIHQERIYRTCIEKLR